MRFKRGQIGNLQTIIFTIVIVVILVSAGFLILGTFLDQTVETTGSNSSAAALGLNDSLNAFGTIPNLLPLVFLIAMIVIILALVFTIPGARSTGA